MKYRAHRISAHRISTLVLDDLGRAPAEGSVHSVFESTVNILCEARGAPGAWVSLHAPRVPMHPHAVLLGPGVVRGPGLGLLGATAGEPARLGASRVVLGEGRVQIALEGAEAWNPWLEPLGGPGSTPGPCLAEALRAALDANDLKSPFLRAAGGGPGTERVLEHRCRAISRDLVDAWRHSDIRRAARVMMSAVGLGTGLTPSGDDFVLGFLGAAHFFAYGEGRRAEAGRSLHITRSMTTAPAFFMLRGALEGMLPEPLSHLLMALGGSREAGVLRAVRRLSALGATSGQDMLAGVICYLEAATAAGECE